jgi:hypothetical protein
MRTGARWRGAATGSHRRAGRKSGEPPQDRGGPRRAGRRCGRRLAAAVSVAARLGGGNSPRRPRGGTGAAAAAQSNGLDPRSVGGVAAPPGGSGGESHRVFVALSASLHPQGPPPGLRPLSAHLAGFGWWGPCRACHGGSGPCGQRACRWGRARRGARGTLQVPQAARGPRGTSARGARPPSQRGAVAQRAAVRALRQGGGRHGAARRRGHPAPPARVRSFLTAATVPFRAAYSPLRPSLRA